MKKKLVRLASKRLGGSFRTPKRALPQIPNLVTGGINLRSLSSLFIRHKLIPLNKSYFVSTHPNYSWTYTLPDHVLGSYMRVFFGIFLQRGNLFRMLSLFKYFGGLSGIVHSAHLNYKAIGPSFDVELDHRSSDSNHLTPKLSLFSPQVRVLDFPKRKGGSKANLFLKTRLSGAKPLIEAQKTENKVIEVPTPRVLKARPPFQGKKPAGATIKMINAVKVEVLPPKAPKVLKARPPYQGKKPAGVALKAVEPVKIEAVPPKAPRVLKASPYPKRGGPSGPLNPLKPSPSKPSLTAPLAPLNNFNLAPQKRIVANIPRLILLRAKIYKSALRPQRPSLGGGFRYPNPPSLFLGYKALFRPLLKKRVKVKRFSLRRLPLLKVKPSIKAPASKPKPASKSKRGPIKRRVGYSSFGLLKMLNKLSKKNIRNTKGAKPKGLPPKGTGATKLNTTLFPIKRAIATRAFLLRRSLTGGPHFTPIPKPKFKLFRDISLPAKDPLGMWSTPKQDLLAVWNLLYQQPVLNYSLKYCRLSRRVRKILKNKYRYSKYYFIIAPYKRRLFTIHLWKYILKFHDERTFLLKFGAFLKNFTEPDMEGLLWSLFYTQQRLALKKLLGR